MLPRRCSFLLSASLLLLLLAVSAEARNPYRRAFFSVYPTAEGTRLDDLPSNAGHCGVCHFDFDGSGTRNPYGLTVQVALNSGNYGTTEEAILSLDGQDADGDGFSNAVEIADAGNFTNTPTFPGLTSGNVSNVLNVDPADLTGYLTPSGSLDTTPPTVLVTAPDGGEIYPANTLQTVSWTASDASGISHVDLYLSDDGGLSFKPVAKGLADTGTYSWFVPNRPGSQSLLEVVAWDNAGNDGSDSSNGSFSIEPVSGGIVPTTLRDFDLPGSQPLEAGILDDPGVTCVTCHGNYNTAVEPWFNWRGSMMGQAMRDPLYLATLVVAEQDAPSVGDLCLRCHTPGGWLEGRSPDTSGGLLNAKDRQSVQCDFCHRQVDPHYVEGISPPADLAILDALATVPLATANGQFVTDPAPMRRGPYADAQADHQFLESPFHREGDICGTCHDVSNPVFVQGASPSIYEVQALDSAHPDGDLRNMYPIERTYSEWSTSTYASAGVYAPQFAGTKPDGIVSTCQDCHMPDVAGKGAAGGPNRMDLPLHDLTGGNHFVPDILPAFYATEVDPAQLADGKSRAVSMLTRAASLELTSSPAQGQLAITTRVINETGHKLPSGYPEGRRIWLNVRAYDAGSSLVYESGAYDPATGELTHDEDAKIYHIEPGISSRLAPVVGLPAGPSFHFALNDSAYLDNRIPPRGFTNAGFAAVQAAPVGYTYADGQYWDDTVYILPLSARSVEVILYYQSTSKEYVEFLRDENVTNTLGQELYDAWVAQGRASPVIMATASLDLDLSDTPPGGVPHAVNRLGPAVPNPFNPQTRIDYELAATGQASLRIYDATGRLVRTLADGVRPAGAHAAIWDGRDTAGRVLASGIYFCRLETPGFMTTRKLMLLK
jgi:hypothetical protein